MVLASGATAAIATLTVGAKVLATDPKTGKTAAKTIQQVWVNHDDDLLDLTVDSGGPLSVIHTTQHHLFWDATTKAWTEAGKLRSGDLLRTDDGTVATAAGSRVVPGQADMWDLTVQGDHDFYVTTTNANVLVHNCPDSEYLSRTGQIAKRFGVTGRQVKDAIHAAKAGKFGSGPVRNPDVEVDPNSGEIYPKIHGGRGDSIGNLWDLLGE